MKLIQYFKKRFKKPVKLNCGSIDTRTGECTTAFQDGFGNVKYKPTGTTNLWKREYFGVADRWKERTNIFSGKTRRIEYPVAIYKEVHQFTGDRMYYVDEIGYINTDAFEQNEKIIPIIPEIC